MSTIILDWFDETAERLTDLRRARSSDTPGSTFNAIALLTPNENRLSRLIAELLNPLGLHGAGSRFLDAFLRIEPSSDNRTWSRPQGRASAVLCEAPTRGIATANRRVDVEIRFERGIVLIENKPWAGEQIDQIGDYLDYLDYCCPPDGNAIGCLYYLTPAGESPKSCKTPEQLKKALESGRLRLIRYADLATALKETLDNSEQDAREFAASEPLSPRLRYFVRDLIDYIQHNLVESMTPETKSIVAHAMLSADNVKAALQIALAASEVRRELMRRFMEQFERAFADQGLSAQHWHCKPELDLDGRAQCGIVVQRAADVRYRLRYIFDTGGYGSLAFGIEAPAGIAPDAHKTRDDFRKALGTSLTQIAETKMPGGPHWIANARGNNSQWPWWIDACGEFHDWRWNTSPWTAIARNDELAIDWVVRVKRTIAALSEAGQLHWFDASPVAADAAT